LPLTIPEGVAEAGTATTTVAQNIITSKTENLLFKASLLHFCAIATETIARMIIERILQMG
jgi:hypothetical protein